MRVAKGKRIQLTFSDLELHEDCKRSSVTVYNGYSATSAAPVLGVYCSQRGSFIIESSSNEMMVMERILGNIPDC